MTQNEQSARSDWLKLQAVSRIIAIGNNARAESSAESSSTRPRIKSPFNKLMKKSPSPRASEGGEISSDRLKVFVGTWNMYGRLLPIDLATFLTQRKSSHEHASLPHLDQSATHPYHLLAIGTQECERDISESLIFPSKELWEKRLTEYLGEDYLLLQTETLAALHLAVFVWKPVSHYVQGVHSDKIKTGWANMIGNKGAVAISVLFGSQSLLFINCHLRAHQSKLTERNANVHRILHELKVNDFTGAGPSKGDESSSAILSRFRSIRSGSSRHRRKEGRVTDKKGKKPKADRSENHALSCEKSVLQRFDHVFMFGDTNYRINADRQWVLETIKKGDFQALLKHDQLTQERQSGTSPLSVFREHPIDFPPTYKLDTIAAPDELSSCSSSCSSSSYTNKTDWFSSSPSSRRSTARTTPNPSSTPDEPPLPTSPSSSAAQPSRHRKKRSQSEPVVSRRKLVSPQDLCYDSSPKQRVPSWTDRILWYDRNNNNNASSTTAAAKPVWWKRRANSTPADSIVNKSTVCWWYSAVLDEALVGVSDHMPVVGVYGVYFDEWRQAPTELRIQQKKKKSWWHLLLHKKSRKT